MCMKFENMVSKISKISEDANLSDNTRVLLINRVSNLIRRYKLDAYMVYLSLHSHISNGEPRVVYETIHFNGGKLFVTLVVD